MAIENAYETIVKPSIVVHVKGRLSPNDGKKFEAKGPWHCSDSHAYRFQTYKTKLRVPHALGHRPSEFVKLIECV